MDVRRALGRGLPQAEQHPPRASSLSDLSSYFVTLLCLSLSASLAKAHPLSLSLSPPPPPPLQVDGVLDTQPLFPADLVHPARDFDFVNKGKYGYFDQANTFISLEADVNNLLGSCGYYPVRPPPSRFLIDISAVLLTRVASSISFQNGRFF